MEEGLEGVLGGLGSVPGLVAALAVLVAALPDLGALGLVVEPARGALALGEAVAVSESGSGLLGLEWVLRGLGFVPGLVAALAVLVVDLPELGALVLVIEYKSDVKATLPY